MPRDCSIPPKLKNIVISRWLSGQSGQSIAHWIHETNSTRTIPIQTSRSSIERLIEHYALSEELPFDLPAIRRCKRDATFLLDNLEAVANEIWNCIDQADKPDGLPVSRLNVKLRGLAQVEKMYTRRLKLAGIDGRKIERDTEEDDDGLWDRVNSYDAYLRDELAKENVLAVDKPAQTGSAAAVVPPVQTEPEQVVKSVRIDDKIAEKTSANDSSIPLVKAAQRVGEKLAETPAKPVSENERKIEAAIDAVKARIEALQGGKKGSG